MYLFLKQETVSDKAFEKNVKFDVFEPYNKTKLNLTFCSENTMNLFVPMELNKEIKDIYEQTRNLGYNIFDLEDPFYNDICTPFTSSSKTDMLLSDRINTIYYNDDSSCQKNCILSNYIPNSRYINCSCMVAPSNDINIEKKVKFSPKKIYESFFDILKYSNYKTLKCYELVFSANIFKNNKGNIIIILFFLIYLVGIIAYIIKGIKPLKNKYKNEVSSKKETENEYKTNNIKLNKNNIPPKRKKISNNSSIHVRINADKTKKKDKAKKKYKVTFKKKKLNKKINKYDKSNNITNKINVNNINIIPNSIKVYSRGNIKAKLLKKFNQKKTTFKDSEMNKVLANKSSDNLITNRKLNYDYDDFELNQLKFNEAIICDKRPFSQIYISTIKREHKIIFTFFICKD